MSDTPRTDAILAALNAAIDASDRQYDSKFAAFTSKVKEMERELAEANRRLSETQRKLDTATEALKGALEWIGDDPVDRASESGPWLSHEGYEAIEKIKAAYAEVTK